MVRLRLLTVLAALVAVLAGVLGAPAAVAAAPGSRTEASAPTAPISLAAPAPASGASAVPGDVDDFAFDSFDADYTLTRADDETSRLKVVETIVAVFPDSDQNRGIRRSIPDTYNGQPLNARLVSVTDENGAARPAEVEKVDDAFSVVSRADDYLHGPQTYVITYTLENVTWDFPNTGLEFYWDVNGVDWAQPFGRVTARLHLGSDLTDALSGRQACYRGAQEATDACDDIVREPSGDGGATITATATGLAPRETLTLAVGFASGTFAAFDASPFATPFGWLQAIGALGALGAGALAVRARRTALADEPGRPTIIAEYAPPTSVDALESAVLLGQTGKGIPAEVLEQAVVGSIRIIEGERKWLGKKPLVAELVDPSRADGDGRMLLEGLFPGGEPGAQFTFGSQDTRFSSAAQKILSAADRELTARGMRRTVAAGTRAWPIVIGALAVVAAFVFGAAALDRGAHALVPIGIIALSIIVLIAIIGLVSRRPLTAKGAEARDHLRGLAEFISWAEADRIRMLQSPQGAERVAVDVDDPRQKLALYEKLLPYAVVFGQEGEWSRQLAVLYSAVGATGPYWYAGSGVFDASSFASGVGSLSAAASSSSSTSGGSSGGGSAGGGGGGGGGGGV